MKTHYSYVVKQHRIYRLYIKRILDVFFSLLFIILFCWLYIILALLVRVKLGSPVLFKQPRPGKDEKIFNMYKFRTMTDARDTEGRLLPDSERLTGFGRLLRKTSLDELPEMFCILKGDMSFIGPRPLLVEYLPYYTERERLRHTVRPGLTGLAQASGRNTLDWDKRFETDALYVEKLSFIMDIKVILMTVGTVFGHSEQVADDTAAVEGNFAKIRQERLERTGKLEKE